MKLTTKYLLALITTVLLLNLSVAEAVRPSRASGMGSLAYIGPQGPQGLQGPIGPQGPAGADVPVHMVGESYQGGIIFWVDADGQHGLIAAKVDQNGGVGIQWYNGTYFATNATADGIYAGAKNTEVIISTQTNVGLACTATSPPSYCNNQTNTAPYAALVAANYSIQDDGTSLCTGAATETCYGDWYLPSKFELNLLYAQKTVVGGFNINNYYWSSTESTFSGAWYQTPFDGYQGSAAKNQILLIRAIRAF